MELEQEEKRDNFLVGTIGALLGSLLGAICIVILGQMGYVATMSGVVMAVCSLKGYERLGGHLSKKGIAVSGVLVVAMTYFANRLDWAISITKAYDINVLEVFLEIDVLLEVGIIQPSSYWGGLGMLYLFTLVGAVPTIVSGARDKNSRLTLLSLDAEGAGDAVSSFEFYPAQKGWIARLRASVLISLVLPLVLAMLGWGFFSVSSDEQVLGSVLAMTLMIGSLVVAFLSLPSLKLCQAEDIMLVRDSHATIWRVSLSQLSAMDRYQFGKRSSIPAVLRWEKLTPEQQEEGRVSIVRAIADLGSGQASSPGVLGRVVLPLEGVELIKEDRWSWKISYQSGGRRQKMAIPKVYPGLRLSPEAEEARAPVPFRWGQITGALCCVLVFALIGVGVGVALEGGLDAVKKPIQAQGKREDEPRSVSTHTIKGVTYEIDSALLAQGADQYFDEGHQATFSISVGQNIDEQAAAERLVQSISDYRTDPDFDRFTFDYTGDSWAQLITKQGDSLPYNIVTIYFKDDSLLHTGVVFSENGDMLVVDVRHDRSKDEERIMAELLRVLESVVLANPSQSPEEPMMVPVVEENYQSLFQPATEMGYDYVGLAYYKAPEMLYPSGSFLEAYLPYGEELIYQEDGRALQSAAHGIQVHQTSVFSAKNAKAVVEEAYDALVAAGVDLHADGIQETQYLPDLDIACKQISYYEENRTKARLAFLYADVKSENGYLLAQITYMPEQMDEQTPALLTELSDAFALTFPMP